MKERPILFSAPMVRAILDGTKTVTRRIVTPQPEPCEPFKAGKVQYRGWHWPSRAAKSMVMIEEMPACSPYGSRGDRLWVRETWQAVHFSPACDDCGYYLGYADDWWPAKEIPKDSCDDYWKVVYAATHDLAQESREERGFGFRPGIHMPRWASRITLEVVSVRVERLHDITEDDARAEGVERHDDDGVTYYGPLNRGHACAKVEFERLWDVINGDRAAWSSNPWVWRVEFKRVEAEARAA